ncbi:MAG: hypothetical protein JSV84_16805 [Gemmatimonadota bacterium]|nr:MAG: hypothetical protein JSV84_16805 [Gemmatimonadota bacterium]
MDRKEFVKSVCTVGACSCVGAFMIGINNVSGQESTSSKPGDPLEKRAIKRMEFADLWVKRFINVLDNTLDEETRKKVMMTNGKICYQEWIKSTGQQTEVVPYEKWVAWVGENVKDGSFQIEGNVIYYQYMGSAETGQAAPENVCLCPMVESKPAGLSKTYCLCSVGYVKEMFEQMFGKPVDVQLVASVLYGGSRCKFKIALS